MPVDLFVMQQAGTLHLSDEARAMLKYYHAAALVGECMRQEIKTPMFHSASLM